LRDLTVDPQFDLVNQTRPVEDTPVPMSTASTSWFTGRPGRVRDRNLEFHDLGHQGAHPYPLRTGPCQSLLPSTSGLVTRGEYTILGVTNIRSGTAQRAQRPAVLAPLPPSAGEGANRREEIAAYLRNEIFSGRLRPGTKIDQDAVARAMATSRIPVREALVILEREALVVWSPFRGTFVANITEQDVRDHFALLAAVGKVILKRLREHSDPTLMERVVEATARCFESEDEETASERLADLSNTFRAAGISHRLIHEFESLTSALPLWRFAQPSPIRHSSGRSSYYEVLGERVIRHLRGNGAWTTGSQDEQTWE
jgi:DNA-binding GntR family transcriptional regulator